MSGQSDEVEKLRDEVEKLHTLAKRVIWYLVVASVASFVVGFFLLGSAASFQSFLGVASVGLCGSGVAALTSCLNRYAAGFELDGGSKSPPAAKGETFNRRMAQWFYVRPLLGFIVAPVFLWGVGFFVSNPEEFTASPESVGFTAFLGGLLAKSVLDLIKGLFKNVFNA